MEIDPYKIPAFQRKNKIGSHKKTAYYKMSELSDETERRGLSRLKKESAAAEKANKIMEAKKILNLSALFENSAPSSAQPPQWRKMAPIGEITHHFAKINVAVLSLKKPLKTGDRLMIQSPEGLFEQSVDSMQIDRQDVKKAKQGDDVGLKIRFEPLIGGTIYKVIAEG